MFNTLSWLMDNFNQILIYMCMYVKIKEYTYFGHIFKNDGI